MKKYKHIPTNQTYYTNDNLDNKFYLPIKKGLSIPASIVENGKDWVKVETCSNCENIECNEQCIPNKEYTILEFKNQWSKICINEGIGQNWFDPKFDTIWSIRRESDGEIFTIGDTVEALGYQSIITKIDTEPCFNDSMRIHLKDSRYLGAKMFKKVKPKEWEITKEKHILHDSDEQPDEYIIEAVKRLSDGVEFKLGDKALPSCNIQTIEPYTIISFYHVKNDYIDNIKVKAERKSGGAFDFFISYITKKEKLFTTEDEVDIHHKDTYWFVTPIFNYGMNTAKALNYEETLKNNNRRFSTKEAAKEFVLMNKPCLSVNDIKCILNNSLYVSSLRKFVKQKYNL